MTEGYAEVLFRLRNTREVVIIVGKSSNNFYQEFLVLEIE